MGDALTQNLLKERGDLESRVLALKELAASQNRDLTPADQETLTTAMDRMAAIDGQLEVVTREVVLSDQVRSRLSAVAPSSQLAFTAYRSAGALLHDMLHQSDRDAAARYASVVRRSSDVPDGVYVSARAAEHMGTTADNTTPVAGGFGGLIVQPVVGPVISLDDYSRPFLSAIGVRPAPDPLSFRRPRLVDAANRAATDTTWDQGLEKAELASKHFSIESDTLDLQTIGGYLNISQQLLSLNAAALDIVLTQLNRRLAVATERKALKFVNTHAKVTSPTGGVDFADGKAVRAAIFTAAAHVYAATGALPEWVAMGPQGWVALGSLVDLANRPLFPAIGPVNAIGSASPGTFDLAGLGFRGIVTHAISDGSLYLGNGIGFEAYEYRFPVLEAVEPSVLGRQVAVASAVAFYAPPTTEATTGGSPTAAKYEGIAKIVAKTA